MEIIKINLIGFYYKRLVTQKAIRDSSNPDYDGNISISFESPETYILGVDSVTTHDEGKYFGEHQNML